MQTSLCVGSNIKICHYIDRLKPYIVNIYKYIYIDIQHKHMENVINLYFEMDVNIRVVPKNMKNVYIRDFSHAIPFVCLPL